MSDKSYSFESLLTPHSLMAVLVLLGVVLSGLPYKSDRPSRAEGVVTANDRGQDVEARLWHDPLQAIRESVQEADAHKGEGVENESEARLETLRKDIATEADGKTKGSSVQVLAVMLSGGAEAEEGESRLRTRYAVLSSLGRSGYQPRDAEHLGWCRWSCEKMTETPLLAYEWMDAPDTASTAADARPVLVLWLNEREFFQSPVDMLKHLRECLLKHLVMREGRVKFSVIGPRTTDGLVRMLKNAPVAGGHEGEDDHEDKKEEAIMLLSCWATTPDEELLRLAGRKEKPGGRRETVNDVLSEAGISYQRTVCSDDRLARLLVNELRLRRILTAGGYEADSVVLLTEWDTRYGRMLPAVLLKELRRQNYFPTDPRVAREDGEAFPTLRVLSYQRGVDGDLTTAGEKSGQDGEAETQTAGLVEKAVGRHQLDYVRRMIDRFEVRRPEGGRLAVGFLGSDVYDKLLLMQAVRERFPEALFFTTDADARYFHPSHAEWTGNLLVASGYGLSAYDSLKKVRAPASAGRVSSPLRYQPPPMRDCYQTATYLAVQMAIGRMHDHDMNALIEQEEIFEVGREGLVVLNAVSQPRRSPGDMASHWVGARFRWVLCGLPAMWMLFQLVASRRIPSFRVVVVSTVAAVLLLAAAVGGSEWAYVGATKWAEPWSLFDRVSIWPSEMLRLLAVGVAVWLMVLARRRVRLDRLSLAREYGLGMDRSPAGRTSLWRAIWERGTERRELRSMFRRTMADLSWQLRPWRTPRRDPEESENARWIWRWYGERSRPADRAFRVGIHWLCYLALCGIFFIVMNEPPPPARGDFSFFIDQTLQVTTTLLITLLAAYVVDASLLSSETMVRLARRPTAWPAQALEAEAKRIGVDKGFLDGWLDLHFAGSHTRHIGQLVYYPCIVWFLLLLARWNGFDRWTATPGLIAIYVTSAVVLIANAVTLHRAAEKVRLHVLSQLKDKLVAAEGDADVPTGANPSQLRLIIERVEGYSEGAFTPLLKQPVVGALLMSFSGTSAFALFGKAFEFFG